jgi:hypothetical protein
MNVSAAGSFDSIAMGVLVVGLSPQAADAITEHYTEVSQRIAPG